MRVLKILTTLIVVITFVQVSFTVGAGKKKDAIHDILKGDKLDPNELNYATDDFRVDNSNQPVKIEFGYKKSKTKKKVGTGKKKDAIHDMLKGDKLDPNELNYATDDFRVHNGNQPVKIEFGYKKSKTKKKVDATGKRDAINDVDVLKGDKADASERNYENINKPVKIESSYKRDDVTFHSNTIKKSSNHKRRSFLKQKTPLQQKAHKKHCCDSMSVNLGTNDFQSNGMMGMPSLHDGGALSGVSIHGGAAAHDGTSIGDADHGGVGGAIGDGFAGIHGGPGADMGHSLSGGLGGDISDSLSSFHAGGAGTHDGLDGENHGLAAAHGGLGDAGLGAHGGLADVGLGTHGGPGDIGLGAHIGVGDGVLGAHSGLSDDGLGAHGGPGDIGVGAHTGLGNGGLGAHIGPGDGALGAHGDPGDGGPGSQGIPGDGGPGLHGSPGDGGPGSHGIPGDGGPGLHGGPGDGAPGPHGGLGPGDESPGGPGVLGFHGGPGGDGGPAFHQGPSGIGHGGPGLTGPDGLGPRGPGGARGPGGINGPRGHDGPGVSGFHVPGEPGDLNGPDGPRGPGGPHGQGGPDGPVVSNGPGVPDGPGGSHGPTGLESPENPNGPLGNRNFMPDFPMDDMGPGLDGPVDNPVPIISHVDEPVPVHHEYLPPPTPPPEYHEPVLIPVPIASPPPPPPPPCTVQIPVTVHLKGKLAIKMKHCQKCDFSKNIESIGPLKISSLSQLEEKLKKNINKAFNVGSKKTNLGTVTRDITGSKRNILPIIDYKLLDRLNDEHIFGRSVIGTKKDKTTSLLENTEHDVIVQKALSIPGLMIPKAAFKRGVIISLPKGKAMLKCVVMKNDTNSKEKKEKIDGDDIDSDNKPKKVSDEPKSPTKDSTIHPMTEVDNDVVSLSAENGGRSETSYKNTVVAKNSAFVKDTPIADEESELPEESLVNKKTSENFAQKFMKVVDKDMLVSLYKMAVHDIMGELQRNKNDSLQQNNTFIKSKIKMLDSERNVLETQYPGIGTTLIASSQSAKAALQRRSNIRKPKPEEPVDISNTRRVKLIDTDRPKLRFPNARQHDMANFFGDMDPSKLIVDHDKDCVEPSCQKQKEFIAGASQYFQNLDNLALAPYEEFMVDGMKVTKHRDKIPPSLNTKRQSIESGAAEDPSTIVELFGKLPRVPLKITLNPKGPLAKLKEPITIDLKPPDRATHTRAMATTNNPAVAVTIADRIFKEEPLKKNEEAQLQAAYADLRRRSLDSWKSYREIHIDPTRFEQFGKRMKIVVSLPKELTQLLSSNQQGEVVTRDVPSSLVNEKEIHSEAELQPKILEYEKTLKKLKEQTNEAMVRLNHLKDPYTDIGQKRHHRRHHHHHRKVDDNIDDVKTVRADPYADVGGDVAKRGRRSLSDNIEVGAILQSNNKEAQHFLTAKDRYEKIISDPYANMGTSRVKRSHSRSRRSIEKNLISSNRKNGNKKRQLDIGTGGMSLISHSEPAVRSPSSSAFGSQITPQAASIDPQSKLVLDSLPKFREALAKINPETRKRLFEMKPFKFLADMPNLETQLTSSSSAVKSSEQPTSNARDPYADLGNAMSRSETKQDNTKKGDKPGNKRDPYADLGSVSQNPDKRDETKRDPFADIGTGSEDTQGSVTKPLKKKELEKQATKPVNHLPKQQSNIKNIKKTARDPFADIGSSSEESDSDTSKREKVVEKAKKGDKKNSSSDSVSRKEKLSSKKHRSEKGNKKDPFADIGSVSNSKRHKLAQKKSNKKIFRSVAGSRKEKLSVKGPHQKKGSNKDPFSDIGSVSGSKKENLSSKGTHPKKGNKKITFSEKGLIPGSEKAKKGSQLKGKSVSRKENLSTKGSQVKRDPFADIGLVSNSKRHKLSKGPQPRKNLVSSSKRRQVSQDKHQKKGNKRDPFSDIGSVSSSKKYGVPSREKSKKQDHFIGNRNKIAAKKAIKPVSKPGSKRDPFADIGSASGRSDIHSKIKKKNSDKNKRGGKSKKKETIDLAVADKRKFIFPPKVQTNYATASKKDSTKNVTQQTDTKKIDKLLNAKTESSEKKLSESKEGFEKGKVAEDEREKVKGIQNGVQDEESDDEKINKLDENKLKGNDNDSERVKGTQGNKEDEASDADKIDKLNYNKSKDENADNEEVRNQGGNQDNAKIDKLNDVKKENGKVKIQKLKDGATKDISKATDEQNNNGGDKETDKNLKKNNKGKSKNPYATIEPLKSLGQGTSGFTETNQKNDTESDDNSKSPEAMSSENIFVNSSKSANETKASNSSMLSSSRTSSDEANHAVGNVKSDPAVVEISKPDPYAEVGESAKHWGDQGDATAAPKIKENNKQVHNTTAVKSNMLENQTTQISPGKSSQSPLSKHDTSKPQSSMTSSNNSSSIGDSNLNKSFSDYAEISSNPPETIKRNVPQNTSKVHNQAPYSLKPVKDPYAEVGSASPNPLKRHQTGNVSNGTTINVATPKLNQTLKKDSYVGIGESVPGTRRSNHKNHHRRMRRSIKNIKKKKFHCSDPYSNLGNAATRSNPCRSSLKKSPKIGDPYADLGSVSSDKRDRHKRVFLPEKPADSSGKESTTIANQSVSLGNQIKSRPVEKDPYAELGTAVKTTDKRSFVNPSFDPYADLGTSIGLSQNSAREKGIESASQIKGGSQQQTSAFVNSSNPHVNVKNSTYLSAPVIVEQPLKQLNSSIGGFTKASGSHIGPYDTSDPYLDALPSKAGKASKNGNEDETKVGPVSGKDAIHSEMENGDLVKAFKVTSSVAKEIQTIANLEKAINLEKSRVRSMVDQEKSKVRSTVNLNKPHNIQSVVGFKKTKESVPSPEDGSLSSNVGEEIKSPYIDIGGKKKQEILRHPVSTKRSSKKRNEKKVKCSQGNKLRASKSKFDPYVFIGTEFIRRGDVSCEEDSVEAKSVDPPPEATPLFQSEEMSSEGTPSQSDQKTEEVSEQKEDKDSEKTEQNEDTSKAEESSNSEQKEDKDAGMTEESSKQKENKEGSEQKEYNNTGQSEEVSEQKEDKDANKAEETSSQTSDSDKAYGEKENKEAGEQKEDDASKTQESSEQKESSESINYSEGSGEQQEHSDGSKTEGTSEQQEHSDGSKAEGTSEQQEDSDGSKTEGTSEQQEHSDGSKTEGTSEQKEESDANKTEEASEQKEDKDVSQTQESSQHKEDKSATDGSSDTSSSDGLSDQKESSEASSSTEKEDNEKAKAEENTKNEETKEKESKERFKGEENSNEEKVESSGEGSDSSSIEENKNLSPDETSVNNESEPEATADITEISSPEDSNKESESSSGDKPDDSKSAETSGDGASPSEGKQEESSSTEKENEQTVKLADDESKETENAQDATNTELNAEALTSEILKASEEANSKPKPIPMESSGDDAAGASGDGTSSLIEESQGDLTNYLMGKTDNKKQISVSAKSSKPKVHKEVKVKLDPYTSIGKKKHMRPHPVHMAKKVVKVVRDPYADMGHSVRSNIPKPLKDNFVFLNIEDKPLDDVTLTLK